MKRHGGYASQAKRRGESFIRCLDCTDHPRGYAPPEPETPGDFWRAFASFAVLIVSLYALVLAAGAVALAEVAA